MVGQLKQDGKKNYFDLTEDQVNNFAGNIC
jgi:hypothetical protein